MNSSNTSSWESSKRQKLSSRLRIGAEVLITSSTSELDEFYWSTQKRFLGSSTGFPIEAKWKLGEFLV